MSNLFKNILFLIFVLIPGKVHSEIDVREQANRVVNVSHQNAKIFAEYLAIRDFEKVLLGVQEAMEKKAIGGGSEYNQVINQFNQSRSELKQTSQDLFAQLSRSSVSTDAFVEVWQKYKNLVRQRFQLSFQVQKLVYDIDLEYRELELQLQGFEKLCALGRSDLNAPRVSPNQSSPSYNIQSHYNFEISFNVGQNGQSNRFGANAQPQGIDPKDSNLKNGFKIMGVVSAAVGTVFPLAYIGVGVALAGVYTIDNVEEGDRIHDKMVAMGHQMQSIATDKDIAFYYKNYCGSLAKEVRHFVVELEKFRSSAEFRESRSKKIADRQELRRKFFEDKQAYSVYLNRASLAYLIKDAQCEKSKEIASQQKLKCYLENTNYYALGFDQIVLPSDSVKRKAIEDTDLTAIESYKKKYPPETIRLLVSDLVLYNLGLDWENFINRVFNFTFIELDRQMSAVYNQISSLFRQMRLVAEAKAPTFSKKYPSEQRVLKEFDELKEIHSDLVLTKSRLIFAEGDPVVYRKNLDAFAKRLDSFSKVNKIYPEVIEFSSNARLLIGMD